MVPANGATDAAACSVGMTFIAPTSATQQDDGGTLYRFDTPLGAITEPVPPAGFKPLDASAAELELYGFPARPTDATELSDWTSRMGAYKSTEGPDPCWNVAPPPPFTPQASSLEKWHVARPHHAFNPSIIAYDTSQHWAGYYAISGDHTWIGASGQYDQPARYSTSCTGARQSEWVGIGGVGHKSDNSTGLIQDGTEVGPTGSPYGFYEWIGTNPSGGTTGVAEQHFSLGVSASNHMYASTTYNASTGIGTFYIENQTTGQNQTFRANVATWYMPGTTDWIIERPEDLSTGNYVALQNFNMINWTSVQAENDVPDWVFLNSTHEQVAVTMKRLNGTVLAQPSGVGGTNGGAFSASWLNC
jgi:hypothetical protein